MSYYDKYKKMPVTVILTPEVYHALADMAKRENRSVSNMVAAIVSTDASIVAALAEAKENGGDE